MRRLIVAAAFAVAAFGTTAVVGSAEARIADPSLAATPLSAAQQVQFYRDDRRRDRRHWRHDRGWRSYGTYGYGRRCWNDRVRVWTPSGRLIVRTVRRCR